MGSQRQIIYTFHKDTDSSVVSSLSDKQIECSFIDK